MPVAGEMLAGFLGSPYQEPGLSGAVGGLYRRPEMREDLDGSNEAHPEMCLGISIE